MAEGTETLFGKIWSYDELLAVERPGRRAQAHEQHLAFKEMPANWPSNVEVDRVSKWAYWLPDGWAQGISTTASGKTLKAYMSPEGKRYFHKKDIEKILGPLASKEPEARQENGEKVPKLVTDPDAIPSWPDGDWLPKDWRVCYRQLPTTLHKIFVPPGQDWGFCYHRSTVTDYLAGKKSSISPFGTSRPMAEISANAGTPAAKKSRVDKKVGPQASIDDYEEAGWLSLERVPTQGSADSAQQKLAAAGKSNAEELAKTGREVHGLLVKRGFPQDTEVLAFFGREGASPHWLSKQLCGHYYKMPASKDDRPCYQKVGIVPGKVPAGVYCQTMYIFWSAEFSRWKVGMLDDSKAGWVFSDDDKPQPAEVSKPWMVLKEDFFKQG